MKQRLRSLLDHFLGKRVVVIGDVMLDKYLWGEVSRISPEAPVQVVEISKESYVAGGAANVARNAAALGGIVDMVGISGDDEARALLIAELRKEGISTDGLFVESDRPTTLKMRIMGRSQQLLRVDYEKKAHAHPEIEKKIIDILSRKIPQADAIIVSDYAKGVITKKVMEYLLLTSKEHGKIVVIDPKPSHKEMYHGASLITPNHAEACQMANLELGNDERVEGVGEKLLSELDSNILLTRGEKGMSLFEKGRKTITIPTEAKEVYDVTGAGDTVVATAALSLCAGATLEEAAILSNHAAGIKVGKIGTSTVSKEEILGSIGDE